MALDDVAKLVLVLLALFVLLPFVFMALLMPFGLSMMGSSVGYHPGGWYGVFAIVPLALLVLFGWVGYRLLAGEDDEDAALRELREAYARGDLTTDEFEERLNRLSEP